MKMLLRSPANVEVCLFSSANIDVHSFLLADLRFTIDDPRSHAKARESQKNKEQRTKNKEPRTENRELLVTLSPCHLVTLSQRFTRSAGSRPRRQRCLDKTAADELIEVDLQQFP